MFFASGILNFQALIPKPENDIINRFFSRPLYWILQKIFGQAALAIQILIIIGTIATLIRVFYKLNVKIPKLPKVSLEKYEKPSTEYRKKEKESWSFFKIESKTTPTSDAELKQKLSQATGQIINKTTIESERKSTPEWSLLKEMLKKKVDEKMKSAQWIDTTNHSTTQNTENQKPQRQISFSADKPTFPYSLLENTLGTAQSIDQNFIVEKAKSLEKKLLEFWIPVSIEWFDIWPSIVQIRIKPSEGIKISTIENLENDIKLSLKSKSLRIIAPIPGTDSVGIQIPNPKPSMVKLWDILNAGEFQTAMKKSEMGMALGKGIDGSVEIKYLDEMPHLLVAGATGSGKSVGINDFIVSLMFQNSPADLKFLMVDPKQVELEMYSELPYMLAPIVYDSQKAIKLLQRTVQEMERRYTILKEQRVRNLNEYNAKLPSEKLYRIVFIIDEMADMMISSSQNRKEVENCVNRLAAKARAVGIHLIVATQRPSVNVITGLIKANIPTRIAFGVVSEIDSRTILGRKGAEDLVGKGDMLYMDPSTKFPIRIQAPFVSTNEIEKVVASLKHKYMQGLSKEDIYHPEIIAALEAKSWVSGGSYAGGGGDDDDELIEQAIGVIEETRKASATLLQRKLGVGFARAARILDILEERGVVGPAEGAKPRDIYL